MNLVLSIFVSLALLLGGTGNMPAQPEKAVTWTISNLTIETPEESVTLNPALRLSGAVGSEEMNLHFEIENNGKILMPISGRLTAEEALFSLGNSGNAYRVTDESLAELMGLGEYELSTMDIGADLMRSYGTLLAKEMYDEAFMQQSNQAVMKALIQGSEATVTDTEVEVGGSTVPAQKIEMVLNFENSLKMMDALATCGVPEVEDLLVNYLKFMTAASGSDPLTSYTQLMEVEGAVEEGEDFDIPLTLTIAEQDGLSYSHAVMDMEYEGESIKMDAQNVTIGEESTMEMVMSLSADEAVFDCVVSGSYTGSPYAPTQANYTYSISGEYPDYARYLAGDGQTQSDMNRSSFNMVMAENYQVVDGLKNGSLTVSMSQGNTLGIPYGMDAIQNYGATQPSQGGNADPIASFESVPQDLLTNPLMGIDALGMELSFSETREEDHSITSHYTLSAAAMGQSVSLMADVNRAERQEADGSVTTHYDMDFTSNLSEEKYGLSFDFNRAEGPVTDLFEGKNILDLDDDPQNPAARALGADALGLTADAMSLSTDESVMALANLFGGQFDISVNRVEGTQEKPDPFANASKVFMGTIPQYTAPEGYTLTSVEAQSDFVTAVYDSAEHRFEFNVYNYLAEGLTNYKLADGALEEIDGNVVTIDCYSDGTIYSADLYTSEGHPITFLFDGYTDEAEVARILSGLAQ